MPADAASLKSERRALWAPLAKLGILGILVSTPSCGPWPNLPEDSLWQRGATITITAPSDAEVVPPVIEIRGTIEGDLQGMKPWCLLRRDDTGRAFALGSPELAGGQWQLQHATIGATSDFNVGFSIQVLLANADDAQTLAAGQRDWRADTAGYTGLLGLPDGVLLRGSVHITRAQGIDCEGATSVLLDHAGSTGPVPRPQTSGIASRYGSAPGDYSGSPEVVWRIDLPASGTVNLYVAHSAASDIDIFLLNACDPSRVMVYRATHGGATSEQINWFPVPEPGVYYLVADAMGHQFNDESLTLDFDFAP
jgi:hypothetical protein